MRNRPGIAFDISILIRAKVAGVTRVIVTDRDTGDLYTASLADFDAHGFDLNFNGYGSQRALPLAFWRVERPGEAVQLSLFEAVMP